MCGDATQEAALKLLRVGGKVFLSFFDLQNAFDGEISASGAGVSLAGLYLGSAAHADDIRSLSQSRSATENQATTLIKTEIVALSRTNHPPTYMLKIAGHPVETRRQVPGILVESNSEQTSQFTIPDSDMCSTYTSARV